MQNVIGTYTATSGAPFDPYLFSRGLLSAGLVSRIQATRVNTSCIGFAVQTLTVEKIGRKLWLTLLTPKGHVWTWSIGPRGKVSAPNLEVSEKNALAAAEALT